MITEAVLGRLQTDRLNCLFACCPCMDWWFYFKFVNLIRNGWLIYFNLGEIVNDTTFSINYSFALINWNRRQGVFVWINNGAFPSKVSFVFDKRYTFRFKSFTFQWKMTKVKPSICPFWTNISQKWLFITTFCRNILKVWTECSIIW